MKATDLLKEQHQEVDELFERMERMSQAGGNEIIALRDELVATLVGHAAIEEEIFYPESREALGAYPLIPTSYEEHALVHIMLQKLLSAEPGDESFHARLSVLKELVQHHVQEEEQQLFPKLEGAMGAERLEELGDRMEARFTQVREGNVKAFLTQNVAKSMPAATKGRRTRAAKPTARKAAAAKRPPAKRASTQRAEPARGAQKGRRGAAATTGRKKAAETAPAKSGRAAPARKPSRPAKTTRTGRKGGRSSSASAR
ncbi:hemerythrin domain-containing protein [Sorangium sp. So ce854]|uniref:hemerythrin domain-containing protein n=1 Tax=Sorangium sp. So ce854 TaxID=3133322 RepID=UPI003F60BC1A